MEVHGSGGWVMMCDVARWGKMRSWLIVSRLFWFLSVEVCNEIDRVAECTRVSVCIKLSNGRREGGGLVVDLS